MPGKARQSQEKQAKEAKKAKEAKPNIDKQSRQIQTIPGKARQRTRTNGLKRKGDSRRKEKSPLQLHAHKKLC